MGLRRRLRNHLVWALAAGAAAAFALIPSAGARTSPRAAAKPTPHTKTCGGGTLCATSVSSPLPVGGGKRKVKGGAFIPRYSTVDLAATPQSAQQPIQANSQIVEAVDTTHHLSCAGYRQRVGSLIEFELKSTARTPILYQISDILHDTTARGVHICAGLPYTFKTFGKPARLATLPDGTMGYIGLLPACERDATGKITSTGPCVSRVRQVPALRNRNVLNTIVHLQVPAISQVDPWMGG